MNPAPLPGLTPDDFAAFFAAITSFQPFPWQARLAQHVHEHGAWPDTLDLPTGSGKTATLAVGVFTLALSADRPAAEFMPRRIAMVVDRRVVVDQAYRFARELAEKLNGATAPADGVLYRVAERLRTLAGPLSGPIGPGTRALDTGILRGGMVRDTSWARSPSQPLIITSTVDQLGSRLLFRGYGVSRSMRPVHAGLLANDTLILLDEVHLSRPFAETLQQLAGRYLAFAEAPLPRRFHVVSMSATPPPAASEQPPSPPFALADRDRTDPVLGRRLTAMKPAALLEAQTSQKQSEQANRRALAEMAAALASKLAERGQRAIGVIVNRVDTARFAFEHLRDNNIPAILLTGRMRPLERDALMADILPRLAMGRARDSQPLVVVATQCIEAGADLDFDALITQCASVDALRQRLGRLNRSGEASDPYAAILMRKDQKSSKYDDPVYGEALQKTWHWLVGQADGKPATRARTLPPASLDLGLGATWPQESDYLAPAEHAPVLFRRTWTSGPRLDRPRRRIQRSRYGCTAPIAARPMSNSCGAPS